MAKDKFADIKYLLKEGKAFEYLEAKQKIIYLEKTNKTKMCSKCEENLKVVNFIGESKYCIKCKDIIKEEGKKKLKECRRKYLLSNKGKLYKKNKNQRYRSRKILRDDGSINTEKLNNLFESQEGLCNMCNVELINIEYHLDHIYPLSKGGLHSLSNVQFLCRECNINKSDKIL